MLVEDFKFDSAEALLDGLSPRMPYFRDADEKPRLWFHRGHASFSWPLLPTAFRQPGIRILEGLANQPILRLGDQILAEALGIFGFCQEADRGGLTVPEAAHRLASMLSASGADAAINQLQSLGSPVWIPPRTSIRSGTGSTLRRAHSPPRLDNVRQKGSFLRGFSCRFARL